MFLLSCSKKNFTSLEANFDLKYDHVSASFCEPDVTAIQATTYYFFVTDNSHSQTENDHDGTIRFTPIFDFMQSLESKSNPDDRFGLILFSDKADFKIPLNDENSFNAQLSNLWSNKDAWPDLGFSNMPDGINLVKSTLESFVDEHRFDDVKPKINVVVFLLSDGKPELDSGPIPNDDILNSVNGTGNNNQAGLMGLLKNEVSKQIIHSIKIHTAYYHGNFLGGGSTIPDDPNHKELMKKIAEIGNGKFLEFADGRMVDLTQFQRVLSNLKKQLLSYFVIPQGMKWDTTLKKLMPDSDGDGITDEEEKKLGSNPNLKDSDGDGISDGVSLRTLNHVCRSENCQTKSSIDPICQSYLLSDGQIKDSDGDGLNDCEEVYLSSNLDAIDSNNNFVPDYVEFLIGNNLSQYNMLTGDTDGDGLSDAQELRLGLPLHLHNDFLPKNQIGMNYDLKISNKLANGKICYNLKIDHIPMAFNNNALNIILVYQDALISNSTYFYQAKANFDPARSLTNQDFKQILPNY